MVLRAGGTVGTVVGPRENRARPAIDPLFRSAAAVCGPRVVAVVVSGVLDDGTAGARAVRDAGGTIVVQDPGEAVFAGMPRSVIDHVGADHVLPSAEIGPLLRALTREEVAEAMEEIRPYGDPSELEPQELQRLARAGTVSHFTCPECSGTLWEVDEQGLLQYRCRVGHAYSLQTLHAAQAEQVEAAMWVAMRALEERASLLRRTAEQSERRGSTRPAESLRARATEVDQRVDTLRHVLEQLGPVALPESSEPVA
jgi:two-component system chemotaxis response regulator CheB